MAKKKEATTPEQRLQEALVPCTEWPYKVPDNWCWTYQGNISTFLNGRAYKQAELLEDPSLTPVLRVGNLFTNGSWYYSDLELEQNKYINNGDLIYAWSASFGPFIWQNGQAIYHYHIWKIIISDILCKEYYYYWLMHDTDRLKIQGHGTGMIHITKDMMENTAVPLPPLPEQQRIVDRIESLFTQLDEAKEKAQAALDSFESRKAAILHKAFTGELTAKWREEHGVEMESWKHEKYCDFCSIVRGGSPRPAGSPEFYDGPIPFMKVADITRNPGPYVSSAEYSIKEAGLKKTRLVKASTLLLTNSGATLGVPAICTFDTTFNDGIAAFLGLDPDTLLFHYYFWTSKTAYLRSINKGAAQPNLNTEIIGAVEINLPSKEEQLEIVRILDSLLAKEQQAKDTAEAVLEQIDLTKKSILSRAFRGELGTNDPSDSSATALLKEILSQPEEKIHRKKPTVIPNKLQAQLKTELEKKIVKQLLEAKKPIALDVLMTVSSQKFELMQTVRNLENRGIIMSINKKYKLRT